MSDVPEHLLGYTSGRYWLDMSRYVVHFTDTESSFISILSQGFLRPSGPYGWGRNVAEVKDGHTSACFSEVPLNHIRRLIDRHGGWGIGFEKKLIANNGGGRVWYIDDDTPLKDTIFTAVGDLLRKQEFASEWWRATPFIDLVSPKRSYEFEWEREWRVPGGLRFSFNDVAFIWPNDSQIIEKISVESRPAWTPSGEVIGGIESNLAAIGTEGDRLVDEFFRSFTDPINELYYDENGGYAWPDSPWSTSDAVDHVFPDLEVNLRSSLLSVLEEVCSEWLLLEDLS